MCRNSKQRIKSNTNNSGLWRDEALLLYGVGNSVFCMAMVVCKASGAAKEVLKFLQRFPPHLGNVTLTAVKTASNTRAVITC